MTGSEHIGLSLATGQGKSAGALARPPDSSPPGPEWIAIPGASGYQASHRGKIRSLDRTKNGRFHKGIMLKLRPDGDGYLVFNYTDDDNVRHHNVSVARTVLLAHDPGGYRPGLQACHGPGGQKDNRFPEAIRWDTDEANRADRRAGNPPKPKPAKVCPRCSAEHNDKGRNCHGCVVELGVNAAVLLVKGTRLQVASDRLGYPAEPLLHLAVTYGGLRHHLAEDSPLQPVTVTQRHRQPFVRRLRRVINRARASRQDSDAR